MLKPMIFVFRAPAGPEPPTMLATATIKKGAVQCDRDDLREWLQLMVDEMLARQPEPASNEQMHVFIEELCTLRSGSQLFCSPTPLV